MKGSPLLGFLFLHMRQYHSMEVDEPKGYHEMEVIKLTKTRLKLLE